MTDLKSIVYNAVEQVRPFIETKRHHLSFDLCAEQACVLGDQERLVQIVSNLLHNAAKYTPDGGDIRISLAVDEDAVILFVEDNGIGLSPELQPHVFELFTQAERTPDRSQGGLGIGLSLAKDLTELHGGSISSFSGGLSTGSRFTVRLPLHCPAASHAPGLVALPVSPVPERRLCILVVDDNEDAADMIALYLQMTGHRVFTENSAESALLCAARELPDVCILDIGLPGMDGYELARRLRAGAQTAHALLIAVTGYGQDSDRRNSHAAGFDHHLVKPVDTGQLVELVSHQMQKL